MYKLGAVKDLTHIANFAFCEQDVLDLQEQCDAKALIAYNDKTYDINIDECTTFKANVIAYVGGRIFTQEMFIYNYKNELYVEADEYDEF